MGNSWSQSIYTEEELLAMAGKPLNPSIQDVRSVKFVYEIESNKMYFIPAKRYKFHYEYCTEVLGYAGDVPQFNDANYSQSSKRKYLLGNLDFHDSLSWFIDLSVLDHQSPKQLQLLNNELKKHLPFLENLGILINSSVLISEQPELQQSFRLILLNDLFLQKTFQVIEPGKVRGQLYIVDDTHPLEQASELSIVLMDDLGGDLPFVRGIILQKYQTPLSHICLLAKNRKLPTVVVKQSIDSTLRHGTWIDLRVTNEAYKISEGRPLASHQTTKTVELKRDTSVKNLVPTLLMNRYSASAIGSKAHNFGVLSKIADGGFQIPESGFAVPVVYFSRQLERAGVPTLIDKLRNETDVSIQDSLLKVIRKRIKSSPVEGKLLLQIDSILRATSYTTFRFRSSSNAEDILGFNGAGLYTSTTVDLNDSTHSIERALQKVWASCYSERAFKERLHFGIIEDDVAMAVLVHRSFPEEEANGVALTQNRYRNTYPGISVNVQKGDISVVEPPDGVSCDELVVISENISSGFEQSIEYIHLSSLNNGVPVCTDEELYVLGKAVRQIEKYFRQHHLSKGYLNSEHSCLDIEFKFEGIERKLYIKQVRVL